jgi:hypothetical protein
VEDDVVVELDLSEDVDDLSEDEVDVDDAAVVDDLLSERLSVR